MVHLYSEHDFKQAMVTARGFEWSEAQQPGHPTQARRAAFVSLRAITDIT